MANTDHVIPIKNIIFSEITANLSSSATSITVKTGEGALFEEGMIATIEQLNSDEEATAREVVLIAGVSDDTLTITRGYATCVMDDTADPKVVGNTAQSFTSGAKISVYISKGVLNAIQDVLPTAETYNVCVCNQSIALKNCVLNSCDDWWDALYKEKAKRCYNDCGFGDGSDGDCVISNDTFLDANCEYNFKNLTICENVLVRFCGAGTPRINIQRKFCNMGTIDLRGGTFVGSCSKLDGITGCTVSNNACQTAYTALCFGCGGPGGFWGGFYGCNATNGAGGNGGNGGITMGGQGESASGYNGGKGGVGQYSNSGECSGGGGGGGGGYWTGNGGDGGAGGDSYKGTLYSNGGSGGNGGVWGKGGDGGRGGNSNNSYTYTGCAFGGFGGNGYIGGKGGDGGNYSGGRPGENALSAGGGGNGIVCGGDAGTSFNSHGCRANGGNAINNMYGLIVHACEFYNNCIEAQGGKGGCGSFVSGFQSYEDCKIPGNGGCGANGGKVSIAYVKLQQTGNINISGGCGGRGGTAYWRSIGNYCCGINGANGTAGWCKTCKIF